MCCISEIVSAITHCNQSGESGHKDPFLSVQTSFALLCFPYVVTKHFCILVHLQLPLKGSNSLAKCPESIEKINKDKEY